MKSAVRKRDGTGAAAAAASVSQTGAAMPQPHGGDNMSLGQNSFKGEFIGII